jgi:hypothetical protein
VETGLLGELREVKRLQQLEPRLVLVVKGLALDLEAAARRRERGLREALLELGLEALRGN